MTPEIPRKCRHRRYAARLRELAPFRAAAATGRVIGHYPPVSAGRGSDWCEDVQRRTGSVELDVDGSAMGCEQAVSRRRH